MYERFAKLMADKGVTPYRVSKETGISQSTLSDWKNGKSTPKPDKLQIIADYFGVTIDYLMTGSTKEWEPTITEKDEKDIKKKLDDLINQLSADTGLMYDGEPMDEESLRAVRAALEVAERTAMLEARKKFTPDKYKK